MYGQRIAQLRKERNITQEELAQLVGVTKERIVNWESGLGLPSKSQIKTLASVFQVMPEELFPENMATSSNSINMRTARSAQLGNTQAANGGAKAAVIVFVFFFFISTFISIFFSIVNEVIEESGVQEGIIDVSDNEILSERVICEYDEEQKEIEFYYYAKNWEISSYEGDESLLNGKEVSEFMNVYDAINQIRGDAFMNNGTCRFEGDLTLAG